MFKVLAIEGYFLSLDIVLKSFWVSLLEMDFNLTTPDTTWVVPSFGSENLSQFINVYK